MNLATKLLIAIAIILVTVSKSGAQNYTPLVAGSKYACASLGDGKNAIGVVSKSGYKLTNSFTRIKTAIVSTRTKDRARRNAVKDLLQDIKRGKEDKGFVAEFNRLSKNVLDISGGSFRTDDERIAALEQMVTALNGRIQLRNIELKALADCKSNKKPSSLEASFKVVLLTADPNSVVVLAVVPASLVKTGARYCGSVPSYGVFLPNGGTTRSIGGTFGVNGCPPRDCSGLAGDGFLATYVIGSFGGSSSDRDTTVAGFESAFAGSATFRELKDNEFCN